jgi:hypothetical protein
MKATIKYDDASPAYELIDQITLTNLCVHLEMLYKDEDPCMDRVKVGLRAVIEYFQTPSQADCSDKEP